MNGPVARRLWELYEPVHDVVYFTPECRAAADGLGLRGFWMGYFAMRAAPLGPVGPAPVTASFYGFHPDRAARALPDAWAYSTPEQAVEARRHGASAALHRLWGHQVARSQDVVGRVLAAANQALPRPDNPVQALWQATTTLREHRGDGHVAVLVARGLHPVYAHLLKAAAKESDPEMLRDARKWSAGTWAQAAGELRDRGWLDSGDWLTHQWAVT